MTVNYLPRKELDPKILPTKRPYLGLSKGELEARRKRGWTLEQVEKERALNRVSVVSKRAGRLSEVRKERMRPKSLSPTVLLKLITHLT